MKLGRDLLAGNEAAVEREQCDTPVRIAASILLGLSLVAGCAPPTEVFPSPASPMADSGIAARDLLARLDARYGALRSFRALVEMQYTGPEDRLHVKEVIVVDRPDRLRIEMMTAFGVTLQIATDGRRLCAYHRGDKTYYTGEATVENLARFTRLDLGIHDIADFLTGLPPGRERRSRPKIAFEPPTGLWRVTATLADGGTQTLWFDKDQLPARTEEVDGAGTRRYSTSYADYRTVQGTAVPHRIGLELSAQGATLDLTLSTVTLNEPIPVSLFQFDAPPGAKLVNLDEPEAAG